ncbi:MAG: transporter [Anaerocolumna sp.]|jgi:cell division transport system ATP-binding protein|nr:transporter [Anaerocolumna sp.]
MKGRNRVISAKGVSLRYKDGTLALKDVTMEIKPGELVFLTGPSGSGKTSFLKLLMGMEYPTTGTLTVIGQLITKEEVKNIRKLRKSIGPIYQEFKLIDGRTSLDNVMMGMRFLDIPSKKIKKIAEEAIERVHLEQKKNTLVENLSWGQSQRVAIARAVARKPALILADEPTGNLDYENAINILQLLYSFVDSNTAVIITTHATHLIQNVPHATCIEVEEGKLRIIKGEARVDETRT